MTTNEATSVIVAVLNSNTDTIPSAIRPALKAAGCISSDESIQAYMEGRSKVVPKEAYLVEQISKLIPLGREWKWDAVNATFRIIYGMLGAPLPDGDNGYLWHRGEHPVQLAM